MSVNFWNFELSGTSAVDFRETGTSIDGTIPGLSRMTPEQLKKKLDIEAGTGTSTSGSNIDYNEVNLMITSAVNNSVVSAMSGISTEVNNYIDASMDNIPSIVSAAVSALPKNYKEYVDFNKNMTFLELVNLVYEGKGIKYTYEDDGAVELLDLYIMSKNDWGNICPILLKDNNLLNSVAPSYMVAVPDYDNSDGEPPLIKFVTEIEDISSLSYNFNEDYHYYGHWCDSTEHALATNWKDILNFIDYCSYQEIDAYLKIYMGGENYYPYIARYPRLKLTGQRSYYNNNYSINGYAEDDDSLYKLSVRYSEHEDLVTFPRVTENDGAGIVVRNIKTHESVTLPKEDVSFDTPIYEHEYEPGIYRDVLETRTGYYPIVLRQKFYYVGIMEQVGSDDYEINPSSKVFFKSRQEAEEFLQFHGVDQYYDDERELYIDSNSEDSENYKEKVAGPRLWVEYDAMSIYAYSIKKDIYFDFWNDIDDNRFYLRKIFNMVDQLIRIYENREYSIDNDDDKILNFFDMLWEYQDNITGGTGYSKNYKFIALSDQYDSGYDDYLPCIVFVDESGSTYHILQTRYDRDAEPGNQLYIEYIEMPNEQQNNSGKSGGMLYDVKKFDCDSDTEEYVENVNGVITDIEFIDQMDDEEIYPCNVKTLYVFHGGDLESELGGGGGGGGLQRKAASSDDYMPANLAKVIIHNSSSGYSADPSIKGIDIICEGMSEGEVILSGVAEWGKSYVMDFVGPYVEWRDAPNMVKIPEPPRPNFDNDDEGIK